ncbi:GGDEF domain-containing protein [Streptomyces sp. SA3_actF]|uniref:GGDEF domain-containing protein n=1 Tax=Streptomyces sp. SA3_actF TaxID=682181 RepID=UPI000200092C|nr:diguanylate cyclase [Streptomyces sp. SA3_actF]
MDATALAAVVPVLGWATHSGFLARRLATARRDPLTDLPTRAAFTARASRLLAKSPNAVVLLVDLDDFKAVNDTYGHDAGDAVLTATAQRLALWAGAHGIAARLGGGVRRRRARSRPHPGPARWAGPSTSPSPTTAPGSRSEPRRASATATTCPSRTCPPHSPTPTPPCTRTRTGAVAAGATPTTDQPPERPRSPNFRRSGAHPTSQETREVRAP